jgi:polyhydroxybutyrate depolymerase
MNVRWIWLLAGATMLGAAACSSDEFGPPLTLDQLFGPEQCRLPPDAGAGRTTAGCGRTDQVTGAQPLTSSRFPRVSGVLYVPENADPSVALPLVWVFHGAYASGEDIRERFQLEAAADGGAIFVYPDATNGTWDLGHNSPDGSMVNQVTSELVDRYCIDPQRLFVAGLSAGSVFALQEACIGSGTIRAVAAVASTDARFDPRCCKGQESAIFFHGTADTTIDIGEGHAAAEHIAKASGCSLTTVPYDAHCVQFPGCVAGKTVLFCEHDGGHVVPDFGGEETWKFFQTFP